MTRPGITIIRKTEMKSHDGQSLVSFLMVVPIMIMAVFWMLRLYQEVDYSQRIQSLVWFGLREESYGFMHRTLDSGGVSQEMSSLFEHHAKLEYSNDITFKTNSKNVSTEQAVNDDLSQLLTALSVLNPLDISMVRNATVKITYDNPFPHIPFTDWYSGNDGDDKVVVVQQQGNIWASWTSYVNKPDANAYSYAGVDKSSAEKHAHGGGFPSHSDMQANIQKAKDKMNNDWSKVQQDITAMAAESMSLQKSQGNYDYYKADNKFFAYDRVNKQWYGEAPRTKGSIFGYFPGYSDEFGDTLPNLDSYYAPQGPSGWLYYPNLSVDWHIYHINIWEPIAHHPEEGPTKSELETYATDYSNLLLAQGHLKDLKAQDAPQKSINAAQVDVNKAQAAYDAASSTVNSKIPSGDAGKTLHADLDNLNKDINSYVVAKRAYDSLNDMFGGS